MRIYRSVYTLFFTYSLCVLKSGPPCRRGVFDRMFWLCWNPILFLFLFPCCSGGCRRSAAAQGRKRWGWLGWWCWWWRRNRPPTQENPGYVLLHPPPFSCRVSAVLLCCCCRPACVMQRERSAHSELFTVAINPMITSTIVITSPDVQITYGELKR